MVTTLLSSYAWRVDLISSVSILDPLIHCVGMADYQHVIPIHADIAEQKKRKWMEADSLAGDFTCILFNFSIYSKFMV